MKMKMSKNEFKESIRQSRVEAEVKEAIEESEKPRKRVGRPKKAAVEKDTGLPAADKDQRMAAGQEEALRATVKLIDEKIASMKEVISELEEEITHHEQYKTVIEGMMK